MATIFERVRRIIAEHLNLDESEITPESSFTDDLNADSLDIVEMAMAIEEEFSNTGRKIEIPDEKLKEFVTVRDVVDYLKELGVADEE